MIIYPAIDLLDGKCVRLLKGDFNSKTQYSDDPIKTALEFKAQGATHLHVVDLTGAKTGGVIRQTELIKKIIKESGLKTQIGGGIKSSTDVYDLLMAGADRIIIGSLAVKDPETCSNIITKYTPEKIVLAIDVIKKENDYFAATSGWQAESSKTIEQIIDTYLPLKLKYVLCTDISKDGTLSGPNFELYDYLTKKYPHICLYASGGLKSLQNIVELNNKKIHACIAGKAIYEKKLNLAEAIINAR